MSTDKINSLADDIAYAISCVQDYRDTIDIDNELWHEIGDRTERLFSFYYQLTGIDPIMNKMLDAIRSAEVDTLELPEIKEQNKPTVKPKKLPKK